MHFVAVKKKNKTKQKHNKIKKHKSSSLRQKLPCFSLRALIDLFSWYFLFFQYRSSGNTLPENFFVVLFTRAYVGINYEKTKGEVPLGPLLGKQNKQAKEVYYA